MLSLMYRGKAQYILVDSHHGANNGFWPDIFFFFFCKVKQDWTWHYCKVVIFIFVVSGEFRTHLTQCDKMSYMEIVGLGREVFDITNNGDEPPGITNSFQEL